MGFRNSKWLKAAFLLFPALISLGVAIALILISYDLTGLAQQFKESDDFDQFIAKLRNGTVQLPPDKVADFMERDRERLRNGHGSLLDTLGIMKTLGWAGLLGFFFQTYVIWRVVWNNRVKTAPAVVPQPG